MAPIMYALRGPLHPSRDWSLLLRLDFRPGAPLLRSRLRRYGGSLGTSGWNRSEYSMRSLRGMANLSTRHNRHVEGPTLGTDDGRPSHVGRGA
jgi:hypothetical protein